MHRPTLISLIYKAAWRSLFCVLCSVFFRTNETNFAKHAQLDTYHYHVFRESSASCTKQNAIFSDCDLFLTNILLFLIHIYFLQSYFVTFFSMSVLSMYKLKFLSRRSLHTTEVWCTHAHHRKLFRCRQQKHVNCPRKLAIFTTRIINSP